MHKMSTPLHKNTETKRVENISTKISKVSNGSNDDKNVDGSSPSLTLDIEKENRLSKVISLYSKGLSQDEIADEMKVNQSTVSRDLQFIKQQSKLQIDKYLREDVLFEYTRYFAGFNEITKKLWQIVDDFDTDPKDRIRALALLNQSNDKRYDRLTGGPESYLKIKQSQSELILQEFLDNNPEVKASIDMEKLLSNSSGNKNKKKNGKPASQDLNNLHAFMNKI